MSENPGVRPDDDNHHDTTQPAARDEHGAGATDAGRVGEPAPNAADAERVPASAHANAAPTAPAAPYSGTAYPERPPLPPQAATNPTQPTAPLGGSFGPAAVPPRRASGAAKVAGLIVAAALVGGAAGLGGAYAGSQLWNQPATTVATGGGAVTINNTEDVTEATAIAAKVLPSVVTIEVSNGSSGGSGSGAILSEDGYVVTNTHVITLDGAAGDPTIRVTTSDGRIFDAEVVGIDPMYDLAVIKLVDAEGLQPIEFADSSELNVGDQTVAVGAPLGLSNTVTTGIVSALNRSIEIASAAVPESRGDAEEDQEDGQSQSPFQFDIPGQQQRSGAGETIKISVIQTDAAINPGNSGGALVDGDGALIGINVAIATAGSSSGSGSIGVGFSIPSNIVQRVTDEIIEDGEATHGLLGATVLSAAAVEDAEISGAYVDSVTEGGAAEQAGLRAGDIVTALNGVPVADSIDLTALVRAEAAGAEVTVTFVRDGSEETVEATLGALD